MNRPEYDHHSRNIRIVSRMSSPLASLSIAVLLIAQPIIARAAPLAGECRDASGASHCSAAPSRVAQAPEARERAAQETKPVATPPQEPVATPPADPPVTMDDVKAELQRVFGEDYDKAMMILTHPNCHENRYLDPKAVHRNWVPGKPGVYSSSDWGVFQINDRAQGLTEAEASRLLTDYKYNIQVAKKLFDRSGGRFRLWTCGRMLGL